MVARACANMSSRSLLFIVKIPPPSDVLAYISVGLLLKNGNGLLLWLAIFDGLKIAIFTGHFLAIFTGP